MLASCVPLPHLSGALDLLGSARCKARLVELLRADDDFEVRLAAVRLLQLLCAGPAGLELVICAASADSLLGTVCDLCDAFVFMLTIRLQARDAHRLVRAEGCRLLLRCLTLAHTAASTAARAATASLQSSTSAAELEAIMRACAPAAVYGSDAEEFIRYDVQHQHGHAHEGDHHHPDCD